MTVEDNIKTKNGRKGDPRMRNAVIARLNNPELTLHEALIAGGFNFPPHDKNDKSSKYSIQDPDGALLGQRKNQLSRRLREAKTRIELNKKQKGDPESTVSTDTAVPVKKRTTHMSTVGDDNLIAKKKDEKIDQIYSAASSTFQNRKSLESQAPDDNDLMVPSVESGMSWLSKTMHQHDPSATSFLNIEGIATNRLKSMFPKAEGTDFDLLSIPTISRYDLKMPVDVSSTSINSYPNKSAKILRTHKAEDIHKKTPQLMKSNACELKVIALNACNKLNSTDHANADTTRTILDPVNIKKDPRFKKAIDLFTSDYHNYLQGIMKKAGFLSNEITQHNIECLKADINLNLESDAHDDLKSTPTVCSSHSSAPLKKRKYENILNLSHPKKSVHRSKASLRANLGHEISPVNHELPIPSKNEFALALGRAVEASVFSELTLDFEKYSDTTHKA